MKTKYYIYSQPNHLTSRVVIAREQKQFIKIAFAVHLSAVISAERYRSDSEALKSAMPVFVYLCIVLIVHKYRQSAAQSCLRESLLLNNPTDRTFENRRSRYKELGKKVPQAYRVYVEDTFLPCDAGDARIFSKEMTHTDNQGDNDEQKAKRYYYHSEHLGSAQFVTDWRGKQYEHIEYTPYGELWVEEVAAGLDKLPFRFTGKELDEETGLYYYGARYLDPKYSRWLSGDPALNDYIPKAPIDDEAKKHNENLPGMGGVFNVVNLHVYHYAGNNPVKYTDPDGRQTAAIGLAKILSKIWAVAFAEPTPAGEVIAAAATVCILYLYFVDNAESSPTILETPDSVNNINPKTEFPGYDSNKTIDGFPETNKNNVHNTFPDTDRSTNIFEEYIPAPDSIPGIPDAKIAKRKTPVQKGGGGKETVER